MKRAAIAAVLALAACAQQGAPSAAVPPAIAAYAGTWNGSWEGMLDTTLVVDHVTATTAHVIYEWGIQPAWHMDNPGFQRAIGHFEDGKLVVNLSNPAQITYAMQPDGTLAGTYAWPHGVIHATFRQ